MMPESVVFPCVTCAADVEVTGVKCERCARPSAAAAPREAYDTHFGCIVRVDSELLAPNDGHPWRYRVQYPSGICSTQHADKLRFFADAAPPERGGGDGHGGDGDGGVAFMGAPRQREQRDRN